MGAQQIDAALDKVQQILIMEKALLVSGRARETAELVVEKMSALEEMDSAITATGQSGIAEVQRRHIQTIVSLARENTIHFTAVRNGLKSAISRLEALREDAYVGAYSLDGAKTAFPKATGGYLKKV